MITRRKLLTGVGVGTAAMAGLTGYAVGVEPNMVRVAEYRPRPKAWPSDIKLRIAALSDVHASEPWLDLVRLQSICDRVNALKPDIKVIGVEPEDDRDCLAPIGAFSLGVQQPDIARQMLLIVGADAIKLWGLVFEGRNGHRLAHALVASLPKIKQPELISHECALASRRRHCAIVE